MEDYLKEYEIWVGYYHLGQGHHGSSEPELRGKVVAPNFRVACVLHELRSRLKSIESMIEQKRYIDHQSCRWWYDFEQNSNSWIGKYFETKDEAQATFK